MSKHLKILIAVFVALFMAAPAMAMKFDFHGDFNNRFLLYTDQALWFSSNSDGKLHDDDRPDTFGEAKYRLVVTAATDDGAVKGVYAIELGALKFGAPKGSAAASAGGSYSGDQVNIETRWAYTDFQIPGVASKARIQMGLFSNKVNEYFWSETIMGVKVYGDNWYIAWLRPNNEFPPTGSAPSWGDNDLDTLNARYDLKMEPVKLGFFASYFAVDTNSTSPITTFNQETTNEVRLFPSSGASFDLFALGVDGGWSGATGFGKAFVNWDFVFETGGIDDVGTIGNDLDISGWLAHADVGVNFGNTTLTYMIIYATGDDDPNDNDLENFLHVDVDHFDSFIFQESLTDDNVFFEGVYVRNKGIIFNKLSLDHAMSKQTKLGLGVIYLMTAEDLVWTVGPNTFQDDGLGIEIDAYAKHKLYDNLELSLGLGYLIADDAMDFFETSATQDGKSDVDILLAEARVRYQF